MHIVIGYNDAYSTMLVIVTMLPYMLNIRGYECREMIWICHAWLQANETSIN